MKFNKKLITTISITQVNRGHTIIQYIIVSNHQRNTTKASIEALEQNYSQNMVFFTVSILKLNCTM